MTRGRAILVKGTRGVEHSSSQSVSLFLGGKSESVIKLLPVLRIVVLLC